jgi:hypothetical protein
MKPLLLSLILTIAIFDLAQSQQPTKTISAPCTVGRTQPAVGFWTWPAGTEVNVYLREPDFSNEYALAVDRAIHKWNATTMENGSQVHFTLRGMTQTPRTALGDLTLVRGDVFTKKEKHLALLEAHSLRHDQLIDYALVIVDRRVENPAVLTNVMAHEFGHSLGLMDCYGCAGRTTAMGLMKSATETNGVDGPTACDTLAVQLAYREFSARIKTEAAITKTEKTDEGEEPVADDTPIIKPPR